MPSSPDDLMQSFVIRIWIEEPAAGDLPRSWRGHIVHVPSGRRRYFHVLDDAFEFVADQLHQLGLGTRSL